MTTRQRIRRLFLRPKRAYTPEEAGNLIGRKENLLWDAMDAGEIETERAVTIPWSEVAELAIQKWSQEKIEEALGNSAEQVIPAEVRLTELRVWLPRFQVSMLRRLATRRRSSISAVLANHLLDLASSDERWLKHRHSRFQAALQWPAELDVEVE